MAYQFKLQKILDLKLKLEDDKKNQIAIIMQQINEKQVELDSVIYQKKTKEKSMTDSRNKGVSILEIRNINQFILFLDKKINNIKFEISSLESKLKIKREEYIILQKERKTFEKLKEKDIEKFKYNEKKEEEKIVDQIVTFTKNNSK